MVPLIKTHVMTGGPTGAVIDLGNWYNKVRIVARGECQLRQVMQAPGSAAPAAPGASMIPSAGNDAADGVAHLFTNDTETFGPDPSEQTKIRYIPIWEPAAGAGLEVELEAS